MRAELQTAIDRWHRERAGQPHDAAAYRAFLEEIGYLVPTGPAFSIDTDNLDPEISTIPGPQLVVPVTNARYAINAANARWGSLYDALYGTDALGDLPTPGPYDPARGARVIAWARSFLDAVTPMADVDGTVRSHADVTTYRVAGAALVASYADGRSGGLADPTQLAGFTGSADDPTSILLEHHGLGIEIVIDRAHPVGSTDSAGVADVVLEVRSHIDHGLRGFDRRRRQRRQGTRLSQLARPGRRHADGGSDQERERRSHVGWPPTDASPLRMAQSWCAVDGH